MPVFVPPATTVSVSYATQLRPILAQCGRIGQSGRLAVCPAAKDDETEEGSVLPPRSATEGTFARAGPTTKRKTAMLGHVHSGQHGEIGQNVPGRAGEVPGPSTGSALSA